MCPPPEGCRARASFRRQQLRAVALRNCEVEVHPASSITDAARLWARRSYDLVLLAAEENSEEAALLSNELQKNKPRQRMALLVGAPEYIRVSGALREKSKASVPSLSAATYVFAQNPSSGDPRMNHSIVCAAAFVPALMRSPISGSNFAPASHSRAAT